MAYSIRVRLRRGGVLEADTDPDAPEGAPGAERVPLLQDVQPAVRELCQSLAPEAALLGMSDDAAKAYASMIAERAMYGRPFTYHQGFSLLWDGADMRRAEVWDAQVDIAAAQ
jgi:hypothetical protein